MIPRRPSFFKAHELQRTAAKPIYMPGCSLDAAPGGSHSTVDTSSSTLPTDFKGLQRCKPAAPAAWGASAAGSPAVRAAAAPAAAAAAPRGRPGAAAGRRPTCLCAARGGEAEGGGRQVVRRRREGESSSRSTTAQCNPDVTTQVRTQVAAREAHLQIACPSGFACRAGHRPRVHCRALLTAGPLLLRPLVVQRVQRRVQRTRCSGCRAQARLCGLPLLLR